MSLFPVSAPPPQVDVKPYFELRQRFERRTNRDFDSRIDDDRGDLLSRWRVGAKLDFRNGWRGEIQYQYAHDLAWTRARNFSDESSDVSLAYAESALPGWTATLGRQKIAVGQQRLIGPSEWANVPRSMDGVRFRNPEWDLFAFKIGVGAPRSGDARVAGLVHQNKMYGDTMLVFKHDQMAAGSQDIWTLSHLFVKSFGKVTVDAEAALQTGRN
ncbi:MAG TPA: alginate export family protein, partial [Fimbriimonadaceae bacterium]|nr:alginate export family protein [Fimbriimonadaceae bacterium]